MASISDIEKARTDIKNLQTELNNISNKLSGWSGQAKDDFISLISDLNNGSNAYSITKVISSLDKFITDYKNAQNK